MKKNKKLAILSSATIATTLVGSFTLIENSINNNSHNLSNFVRNNSTQTEIPKAILSTDEYGVQKLFINYQGIRYGIKYINNVMGTELIVDGISTQTLKNVNDLIVIQDNLTFSWEEKEYTFDVRKIKEKAFKGDIYRNSTLVIGNNINEIGDQTFQSSTFKKIIFPGNNNTNFSNTLINAQYIKNINHFGVSSFEGATGLPEILIFDNSIKEIKSRAFSSIKYDDTTRSVSYYSYKTIVDPNAFDAKFSIKVSPTKFKKLVSQIQYNNKEYQQIKIDDLSQKNEFQNIEYLKDYIIKNIDILFENYPVKINSITGEKSIDLLKENISFNLEISSDKRKIYLTDLSLNYWYDENGNIIQNRQQVFGNLVLTQTIKKTDIKNPINALDLGLANKTAQQASGIIDNVFIFNKLDKILIGDHEVIEANQIKNVSTQINNNQIQLSFSLSSNTWYNEEGILGGKEKILNTTINNFLVKVPTKINNLIDANVLGLGSYTAIQAQTQNKITTDLLFNYKDVIFSGDNEIKSSLDFENLNVVVENKDLRVTFDLKENTWYDDQGLLGKTKKPFVTVINNFFKHKQTEIINPIKASSLNLASNTAEESLSQINAEFVYSKLSNFFRGDHNIKSSNDISIISNSINKNQGIDLEIQLNRNTWYNSEGDLVNFEQSFKTTIDGFQRKNQTQVVSPIEASSLGWKDLTAKQVETKLNREFIFQHINQFLIGDHLILDASSIEVISVIVLNNEINLNFRLSRGTWYDEEGRLGTSEKECQTLIHNFKNEVVHTQTGIINPIDSSTINLNNKTINEASNSITENFIFQNLSKFFTGSHKVDNVSKINIVSKVINDKAIDLKIELSEGTTYDSVGTLVNTKQTFNTSIYNFKQENQKEATRINDPIQALELKLDNISAKDAQSKITEQFILDNKNIFFSGYLNLQNVNEILELKATVSNNELIISFKLKQNTWANKDGELGTVDKLFSTRIVGFKQETIKQATGIKSPIEAKLIGLENKTIEEANSLISSDYIFEFIQIFLIGDYKIHNSSSIKILEKNINVNKLVLTIEFGENTCYDNQNSLIPEKVRFTTEITNFKQEIIKQATEINTPIKANSLWSSKILINEAINQINSDFIFKNKLIFFKGDNEINNSSKIAINKKIVNNEIYLDIQLAANTWYDSNNELGKTPRSFKTVITNFENETIEIKKETKTIDPIDAKNLNWDNLTAEEAKVELTNNFIYLNKEKFLSGDSLLTDAKNIVILDTTRVSNNKIILSFSLSSGTWYDANNQLGKFDKEFSTIIQNFRKNEINEETNIIRPIDAVTIGLNNKTINESYNLIDELFIFNNLNNFFNGNHKIDNVSKIKIIKKQIDEVQKRINLEIQLSENSAYGVDGNLITNKVNFVTYIFNFKQENQKEATRINDPIQALELKLNNISAKDAQSKITEQFILDNKNIFFSGYLNLQNVSEIIDLNVSISNNNLIVSFKLKANTWADGNGQLGTSNRPFSTTITNFKETEIKQKTEIKKQIDARSIGLENKTINEALSLINKDFVFANITNILIGSYELNTKEKILEVLPQIQSDKIKLVLKFDKNTCYGNNSSLLTTPQTFETFIINFKIEQKKQETKIINPIQSSNIQLNSLTVEQALEKINSQFIFEKMSDFFIGDNEIKLANQINVLKRLNQNDNSISLTITLGSSTAYDSQGKLIRKPQNFETKIEGFKPSEKPEQKLETKLVNPIYAQSINLNLFVAIEAIKQIDNDFIFKNITHFFIGNHNITDKSNITIINSNVSNNEINLIISLSSGTWYDNQGKLGKIDKVFKTKITNFKEETINKPTGIIRPIEAKNIGLSTLTIDGALGQINEGLIYSNLDSFFSGNYIIDNVSKIKIIKKQIDEVQKRINLEIQLSENSAYGVDGKLITNKVNFETYIFNFKQENQKEATRINDPIQALSLGLNNISAQEARDQIKNQFIFDNKDKLFTGYLDLQNVNEIIDLNVSISNNNLIVSFKLKANTWADGNGQLGTFDKLFSTTITNFKETEIKQKTEIKKQIDARSIGLENKTINEALSLINKEFIFENIANILIGSYALNTKEKILEVLPQIQSDKIKLTITLAAYTCYDSNGIFIEYPQTFETYIINFALEKINKPTIIKTRIEALKLNLDNLTVYDAFEKIDNSLIFNKLSIFFDGDYKIDQISQINLEKQIIKDKIVLSITLASNTYYDANGKLGQISKTFVTEIINFKPEEQKRETTIIKSIKASALGLNNLTANQALLEITNSLIFKFKNNIFEGDNNINSQDNIVRIGTSISNNTILLSFYLVSSTWYDKTGQLGESEKLFETIITDFKEEILHKPTIINPSIDAIKINLGNNTINDALELIDNKFIFNNINKFFSGDYEINKSTQIYIASKTIVNKQIKLVIFLEPQSCYDDNGKLSNEEKQFTTFIFNFKNEEQKQKTEIRKSIPSSLFGLDKYTAEEAKTNQIKNQFIFDNKDKLFIGYLNLQNVNEIIDLNVSISNNNLIVSFKLKANTWADENGQLGTSDKSFSTTITNFKETEIKQETQTKISIDASLINLNNLTVDEASQLKFENIVFDKKNYFFEGNYEIISVKNIVKVDTVKKGNKLKLSITLAGNTWYDKNGKLGQISKTFKTEIINFKQPDKKKETIINNSIDALMIGLGDQYISNAYNLIDSEFIFENKLKFFNGDLNISKSDQIIISKKQRDKNKIILTIVLASNTWYNQNGILENKTKSFETIIENFKSDQKQETKINNQIQASSLDLEHLTIEEAIKVVDDSLVYKNIAVFFVGDYDINSNSIESFVKEIVGNALEISITLKANTCYDKDGKLIVDRTPKFVTKIINFKESPKINKTYVINPINASSIGLGDKLAKDVISENIINEEFIFENKTKFIGGSNQIKYSSYIKIDSVEQVGNRKINLVFTLSANSWYDENRELSKSSITFKTMIVKLKLDKDLPKDADEYDGVPWTKWWNITLLCTAAAAFPLLIIWIIRKIYKIKSRK